MITQHEGLSTPAPYKAPRPLTPEEIETVHTIANALIPSTPRDPEATDEPDFDTCLTIAVDARADAFVAFEEVLRDFRDIDVNDVLPRLRKLNDDDDPTFQAVTAIITGAWLLTPTVRARIGYSGQRRSPIPLTEAVDQLSDGIMDGVLERGSIYVPTPVDGTGPTAPRWSEMHPDCVQEL